MPALRAKEVSHPPIDDIYVLCQPGAERATLFCMLDGKNRYETLSRDRLLILIQSAVESLRRMEMEP